MRRLPSALATLSTCAAVIAVLAVPASAHDGGHDGERSGHDAVASAPAAPAAQQADDDGSDDAATHDAATHDAADAANDDDAAVADPAAADDGLEFETTLTGSSVGGPVIAGAAAGGRPWIISEGEVEYEDGMLNAVITGLVIPPGGTNPLAKLSVSVVCGGVIAATTAAVPFSATGDAMVSQALAVPDMCAMPQVLVHPLTNTKVYIAFG